MHPKLPSQSNDRDAAPRKRTAHRMVFSLALAMCAALQQGFGFAQGSAVEFDASKKSPAAIAFDQGANVEARGAYVSGNISKVAPGPFAGTDINDLLGASMFYSHGYTGTNAAIANIEAGHIWSGHETLTHVQQIPNYPLALNEYDRHATEVGMILGGRSGGTNPGPYQQGLAPDAQLFSGATATQWNGQRYTLSFSDTSAETFDQFRRASSTGMNVAGRRADVINSSWGSDEIRNGSGSIAIGLDGFANTNPHTLFVACAGNEGPGPDKVWCRLDAIRGDEPDWSLRHGR